MEDFQLLIWLWFLVEKKVVAAFGARCLFWPTKMLFDPYLSQLPVAGSGFGKMESISSLSGMLDSSMNYVRCFSCHLDADVYSSSRIDLGRSIICRVR